MVDNNTAAWSICSKFKIICRCCRNHGAKTLNVGDLFGLATTAVVLKFTAAETILFRATQVKPIIRDASTTINNAQSVYSTGSTTLTITLKDGDSNLKQAVEVEMLL